MKRSLNSKLIYTGMVRKSALRKKKGAKYRRGDATARKVEKDEHASLGQAVKWK
jgi:hypothetical protein